MFTNLPIGTTQARHDVLNFVNSYVDFNLCPDAELCLSDADYSRLGESQAISHLKNAGDELHRHYRKQLVFEMTERAVRPVGQMFDGSVESLADRDFIILIDRRGVAPRIRELPIKAKRPMTGISIKASVMRVNRRFLRTSDSLRNMQAAFDICSGHFAVSIASVDTIS